MKIFSIAASWPASALVLPRFQAHRGYWKPMGLKENSLAAFRAARLAGAEMVELDVRLTADLQVVVFHDQDLSRIGGSSQFVSEIKYAEMKAKTGAPLLLEVLEDPGVTHLINIELKTSEVFNRTLENEVARVVKAAQAENRVLFSSFNPLSLGALARLLPDVPRALLVTEDQSDKKNKFYLRKMLLRPLARPHLLHLNHEMISKWKLIWWHSLGYKVVAWTVNEKEEAQRLFALGVDGIISDLLLS
jgi:glycerophosphoryl diester phosphodiesterase